MYQKIYPVLVALHLNTHTIPLKLNFDIIYLRPRLLYGLVFIMIIVVVPWSLHSDRLPRPNDNNTIPIIST